MISDSSDDSEPRIRRQKFSEAEDRLLSSLVDTVGTSHWYLIASKMPGRTPRQCRDRWNHYLAPQTNVSEWTPEEDQLLLNKIKEIGKQWSKLSALFPGRTGTSVRNRVCKLSRQRGADPLLKNVLRSDSKKKININIVDATELEEEDQQEAPYKFPSCVSLLKLSNNPFATKLCPLMKQTQIPTMIDHLTRIPPLNIPAPIICK